MKKSVRLFFAFAILVSVLAGCKKDESESPRIPVKPQDMDLDLDKDQIVDFKLLYRYGTWDGAGISGDMISGVLICENSNQVLIENNSGLFFNRLNDTVLKDVKVPYSWETASYKIPSLLTIFSNSETGWDNEWSVNGVKQEFYYLSFKIVYGNAVKVGWVKLSIDNRTGKVGITDKELTSDDFIVIDR